MFDKSSIEQGDLVPIEKMLKAYYGALDVDWDDPHSNQWKASRRIAMVNALVTYIAYWQTQEHITDA